jgi:hypothetical protein
MPVFDIRERSDYGPPIVPYKTHDILKRYQPSFQ